MAGADFAGQDEIGLTDSTHIRSGACGIVAISRGGAQLAAQLASELSGGVTVHVVERFSDIIAPAPATAIKAFRLPLRPQLEQAFAIYQRLVLFLPVGAAVRLLAPLLQHKHHDPAVVCVDDAGKFAVSLISGHVGGGDELAREVASILGATAVITSGSHAIGTLAVDLLGREFGWQLEGDPVTVTRVSAAVVNGDPVGVFQESGERDWWPKGAALPSNLRMYSNLEELWASGCAAALIITDRNNLPELSGDSDGKLEAVPLSLVYRPRSLVVGMGCRRGVPQDHLETLLESTFHKYNLSLRSISCIATADIKREEPGIVNLAASYGVPLATFSADQLNGVFEAKGESAPTNCGTEAEGEAARQPTPSAAHRLLGVLGVSEPSALLASGNSELLVSREKTDRATIAIARVKYE